MQVSILCGGKSSRMQSEKGLVLYQNKPFIEHVITAVLPISSNIQLITNTKDYDYLNYKIVKDIVLDKGPMGGIYSALANSDSELNLILSCDIPLISTEILRELIEKHYANFDVTVFEDEDEEQMHPLIGIYSKTILPVLKKAIDDNDLKMMHFLTKVKTQRIPIKNDKSQFFKNINTLAELNELNSNFIQN
ncbi:molybdenum cofactor guanylyltransferase [Flavobacterium sp.]|uniref:molybdenum cofactor guanylyltransferase n=1 Tax=Flavobacterium sp. TaxID=239 RepID=UPI00286B41E2|nr:molybdenum cofactor guanylyltransferase [Flavobacterium sp.]